jgi:hypothetical protein
MLFQVKHSPRVTEVSRKDRRDSHAGLKSGAWRREKIAEKTTFNQGCISRDCSGFLFLGTRCDDHGAHDSAWA